MNILSVGDLSVLQEVLERFGSIQDGEFGLGLLGDAAAIHEITRAVGVQVVARSVVVGT